MTGNDVLLPEGNERCSFAWCATRHGATVHPDDEAHRSTGAGFPARVRGTGEAGPGADADVEVGILRRSDDSENWLVIEVGGHGLALSRDGARELCRVLANDPQVRDALSL